MYRYNYIPYDVRLSRNINYLRTITSLNWLQQIIYHVLDDCSMRAKFRSMLSQLWSEWRSNFNMRAVLTITALGRLLWHA